MRVKVDGAPPKNPPNPVAKADIQGQGSIPLRCSTGRKDSGYYVCQGNYRQKTWSGGGFTWLTLH